MGFRFRQSVRLFPGVRLNLSGSGVSVSVGGPGATVNLGPRGSSLTLGLPGTGLSYRHQLSARGRRPGGGVAEPPRPVQPDLNAPSDISPQLAPIEAVPLPGEIRSAETATLTSPDLEGLKRLINEASVQRMALKPDQDAALASRLEAWCHLRRREQFPLRLILKNTIPKARAAFEEAEQEALKVAQAIALSHLRVDFRLDEGTLSAYRGLIAARESLARSAKVWDVTASVWVDRVKERSVAATAITRIPVRLSITSDEVISANHKGLRFENANGGDLDIFPTLLLMRARQGSDYALVDLRDLRVEASATSFIETDTVPPDAQVIGHTWAKANRDGSPDRRFRDNKQIPIVRYGELRFSTRSGLAEAYYFSNCDAALAFGAAFSRLQAELQRQAAHPTVSADDEGDATRHEVSVSLPPLPPVRGAHEVTALAALLAAIPLGVAGVNLGSLPRAGEAPQLSAPSAVAQIQPSAAAPALPVAAAPPALRPPAGSAATAPTFPGLSTPPPAAPANVPKERLVVVQSANVRSGPNREAPVARVAAMGTAVTVFGRQGPWVQVGDAQPWGWVHATLLKSPP